MRLSDYQKGKDASKQLTRLISIHTMGGAISLLPKDGRRDWMRWWWRYLISFDKWGCCFIPSKEWGRYLTLSEESVCYLTPSEKWGRGLNALVVALLHHFQRMGTWRNSMECNRLWSGMYVAEMSTSRLYCDCFPNCVAQARGNEGAPPNSIQALA